MDACETPRRRPRKTKQNIFGKTFCFQQLFRQCHPKSQFDWCMHVWNRKIRSVNNLMSKRLWTHCLSSIVLSNESHMRYGHRIIKKDSFCCISNLCSFYCLSNVYPPVPSGQWIKQVSVVSCFFLRGLHQAYRSSAVCWLTLLYANIPQLQPAPPSCFPALLSLSLARTHTHMHTHKKEKHTRTSPRDSHGRAVKRKPRWLINSALILRPPYWLSTAEILIQSFAWIILPPSPSPPPPPQQLPPKTDTQTHFQNIEVMVLLMRWWMRNIGFWAGCVAQQRVRCWCCWTLVFR